MSITVSPQDISYIEIEAGHEVTEIKSEDVQVIVEGGTTQGVPGPAGIGVPSGGTPGQVIIKSGESDYSTEWTTIDTSKSWEFYAMNVEYTGVETALASGDVLECTIDGNTIYRFINGTDGANGYPIEDSFYTNFDATNLTNLIVSRG
jgi:hypothetical protein